MVLRVASAEVLPDVEVGVAPERGEVARDLDRPLRRAQQVHHHGEPAAEHARRRLQPEHLLEPDGQDGRLRIGVVDRTDGTAGDRGMTGRQPVETGAAVPGDEVCEDLREVEAAEVGEPLQAGEVGAEPRVQGAEEDGVAHVRPRVTLVVAEEREPVS